MSKPARILLLEDDEEFRELLAEVLEDEGFVVVPAGRGEVAVELAGSESFDLIIADIRMDGIGGLEAIERTQQLQPGIGSLIVSGYASEVETARAEHLDVGAYLKKPFQMQELLQFVRAELAAKATLNKEMGRESVLYRTLDWALLNTARVLDEGQPSNRSLENAAACAEQTILNLGLDSEIAAATRRATFILGCQRLGEESLPDFSDAPTETAPLFLSIVSKLTDSVTTPDDPLPSQVVSLALENHIPLEEAAAEAESLDERYSKQVQAAYQELGDSREKPSSGASLKSSESGGSRSLLSLAHTLERLGDGQSARKAFEKLTADEVTAKERIEGFLGLARLSWSKQDWADSSAAAGKAFRLARERGPLSLARYGLEAALILQSGKSADAESALNLVGQSCRSISYPVGLSLALCALSEITDNELNPEHLRPLHESSSSAELSRCLYWLFPHIFRQLRSERGEIYRPVLIRLAQDFSPYFAPQLSVSNCPGPIRAKVVGHLASARYLPETILDKLIDDPEKEIREIGNRLKARALGKSNTALLRVQSFGNPTLIVNGEPLDESKWRTKKVKYLFFLLASDWGRTFSEDDLINLFWPKANTRPKKNLYWATSGVRSLLKQAYNQQLDPVVRFQHTLALDPEAPRWHDLEEFRRAFKLAEAADQKGNSEEAFRHYGLAASAYTGPYLEGCFYDFAVTIQRETQEHAVAANFRAASLALEKNADAVGLEHATQAVELAPYREDIRILKMRAQIRLGKGDKAVREYEEMEKLLREEYEEEPSTELIEVYHRARLGFVDA